MSTEHLSREAALRWQMGEASEQERAHVESCAACQSETAPLNDALQLFGAAAREWGEARAATSPVRAGRAQQRHATRLGWSVLATVCALLLLTAGIGTARWQSQRSAMQATVRQQQAQQELAQDNALLEEVDQDVSQIVPDALSPLSGSSSTQQ